MDRNQTAEAALAAAALAGASPAALAVMRALYEADRANVYANPRDVPFVIRARLPPYDGLYFRFSPDKAGGAYTGAVLKAYGPRAPGGGSVCDGATMAPDGLAGVVPAAGLHDPGYLEIDAIAAAWHAAPYNPGPNFKRDWIARLSARGAPTWTPADVRQLMDALFGDTLRKAGGRRAVVRLYYSAVRALGGIFRGLAARPAALSLALAALSLAGCSGGCMAPPDITDWPEGTPAMERVEGWGLAETAAAAADVAATAQGAEGGGAQ